MTRIGFFWIAVLSAAGVFCVSCGSPSNSGAAVQGAAAASVPTVEVAKISAKKLSIMVRLPGELQAYEAVAVFPKVTAYVDSISVDRGTRVRSGQVMARLVAPELAAQRAEAQSKLQAAEAQRAEADAKLADRKSTRLNSSHSSI